MQQTNFLLCGQTDSGKSTICGHLLCLVGYFEQRIIDQVRESTAKNKFSSLLDTDDLELELASKDKTKTVAFTHFDFEYNKRNYSIIDTPGHKIYIRSMIEGLFHKTLRAVCIVVSANEGEFYSGIRGTTLEDLLLARSSGCKNLIIVWNKTDAFKPTDTMREFLLLKAKMMSWVTIKEVFVSGYSGEGLFDLLEIIEALPEEKQSEIQPLIESSIVECKVIFVTNTLITAGFSGVIHYYNGGGAEVEFEIEDIKETKFISNSNKPFTLTVKFEKPIKFNKNQRIILRSANDTIGFGAVTKV